VDFLGEVTVAEESGVSLKRFFSRLLTPTPETILIINAERTDYSVFTSLPLYY